MPEITYSNPLDVITFKIFGLFDAFRSNSKLNNMEDSVQIVLLLVSLYKDGIINEKSFGRDFDISKLNTLILESKFNSKTKETYLLIIGTLSDSLIEVFNQQQNYLSFLLFEIEQKSLEVEFPKIFEALLYKLSEAQGKYPNVFIQPFEITRFIMNLAKIKDYDTVYNPFAGLASFATFLNNTNHYYGQEINQKSLALGHLRLLAHGLVNCDYKLEDSIENWNTFGEFDLIVTNPPFNLKLNNSIFRRQDFSLESNIIENSLLQLRQGGDLICIFPELYLFKKNRKDFEFKKYLIENNLINTIISLPSGAFKHTAIGTCIIIINKKREFKNKIRFINGTSFVNNNSNSRVKVLNDLNLLDQIKSSNKKYVRLIDKETIIENDYNLLVSRYFIDQNFKGVRIHEFSSYIRGSRSEKTEIGKVVKVKNLKDNIVNFSLETDELEVKEIPSFGVRKIQQSCLLVALRWRTLKPTYFEYKGEPVYITNDILAIKVDKKIVNINYLVNELYADYVINQLSGLRLTGIIPTLRSEDFFQVKVKLPSIEEQNKKYYSFADKFIQAKVHESEVDYNKNKINIEDENSFLRHQIAGSLKNVRGAFKFVQKIIEEKAIKSFPDLLELKFDDSLNTDLGGYLKIIERDLKSINDSVNKAGNKIDLLDLNIEVIDIHSFLIEYRDTLEVRGQNFYSVEYLWDEDAVSEFELSNVSIEGDKELLRKCFDNIVENAEKHAFDHEINSDNKLQIYLMFDFNDFSIQIDFSNSGKQMPKNMTHDKLIRKGSSLGLSSGDGIGIWFVNEVMKIHKGKLGYTDETGPEGIISEYVTTIELTFPIIPII